MPETLIAQAEPLSEIVANKIMEIIESRQLVAGDQIPTELELIEMLGVGRSSVREAIKILVSRSVLEIRRGKGTFLSPNPPVPGDPLGLSFAPDKVKTYQDLLAVRMALEPWMAREAALNADEDDIREIEKLCDEVERMILAGEGHMDRDVEFHTAIARSTRNTVIPLLIPIIVKSVTLFIEMSGNTLGKETIETHRAITEAIKAHDPEAAAAAMTLHIRYNADRIRTSD
ncbi:MAG: FadR family transcriptional regulator [Firmicutes bacterium]|nr:FadR family transcriptional regulator [Bacillota bacterium]